MEGAPAVPRNGSLSETLVVAEDDAPMRACSDDGRCASAVRTSRTPDASVTRALLGPLGHTGSAPARSLATTRGKVREAGDAIEGRGMAAPVAGEAFDPDGIVAAALLQDCAERGHDTRVLLAGPVTGGQGCRRSCPAASARRNQARSAAQG